MKSGRSLHRSGDSMMIRKTNTRELPFRKSVAFMLVFYWAVLVAWQNISGAEARSSMDLVIKVGLLLYFSWFYLRRARYVSGKILWVLLLAFCLLITAFSETEFPLSNVIAYGYPVIFLTMVYGLGDHYEITRKQLLSFCNWVIAIVLYAAVYAIIFCREQFVGIFSLRSAYGNELTSFFVSNFEYGMYLAAAIISCFICLKYGSPASSARFFYVVSLCVFVPQIILTYSRTSLFALIICLIVIALGGKGKIKYWVLGIMIIAAIVVLFIPVLRQYVYRIVLKGNIASSRDRLALGAIEYYQNGSFLQKIFGFGIQKSRSFFELEYRHGSVHNAYLLVLLYFGIMVLITMIAFLLIQILVNIKLRKVNLFLGTIFLGQTLMVCLMMLTTTALLFTSSIDSYFMTVFYIIVPKYVRNSIRNQTF